MTIRDQLFETFEATIGAPLDPLARDCLSRGLRAFLSEDHGLDALADRLVAALDADVSAQLDAILHHPRLLALESVWRGLHLLVSRIPRDANVKCDLLSCSKEDLLADFVDAPEIAKSGLFKIVYSGEYGPFGGRPYAAVVSSYRFESTKEDIELLSSCARAVETALAVFLAGAHPSLLGRASAPELAALGPSEPRAHGGELQAFRGGSAARFVALVATRVLGRDPWSRTSPAGHRYVERVVDDAERPWVSGAIAVAMSMVRSFAAFRIASHLTGPLGGVVEGVPIDASGGSEPRARSLEVRLSALHAEVAARTGFVPLVESETPGTIACPTAPTCLSQEGPIVPGLSPEDAELNRQLPATLFVTRIGMYLKVLHRESVGTWREVDELRAGLFEWLQEYVPTATDGDGHAGARLHARTRRPFRTAVIEVTTAGAGQYRHPFVLRIVPNWGIDGRFATLAIHGGLDLE